MDNAATGTLRRCIRQLTWTGLRLSLYLALIVWTTWPLAVWPGSKFPVAHPPLVTVPLFNIWTLWWNADRAEHGFADYWDAPIFHPTRDAFAFSEPQPMMLLAAPVLWLSGSRILAYNVYLWGLLLLNGLFAERLVRVMGHGRLAIVCGGGAMIVLPIVHWQRDVVQLMPVWGVLWVWTAVLQLVRRPALARGLVLGLALTAATLTCIHQTLLLVILLAGAGVVYCNCLRDRRWWIAVIGAASLFMLLCGPMLWKMAAVLERHQFSRDEAIAGELSARLGDYAAAAGKPLFARGDSVARPGWRLGAGWLKYAFAAAGLWYGFARRRLRRWTGFLLANAVLAVVLSLGPHVSLGGWSPWRALSAVVPGFEQVRSVFRFAWFVQLAIVLLAAQGLAGALLLAQRRWQQSWSGGVCRCAGAAVAVLLVVEAPPEAYRLSTAPDLEVQREWMTYMQTHLTPGSALAVLPFAPGPLAQDFEGTVRAMYLQTYHGAPLVNGYSGFLPASDYQLRERDANTLTRMRDAGVELIVVPHGRDPGEWLPSDALAGRAWERVHESPGSCDVFRLK